MALLHDDPPSRQAVEDRHALLVISENSRRVYRIPLRRAGSVGRAKPIGRLPDVGRSRNRGYEGIAWLGKVHNPERRDRVVLVHQGRPRRVVLFDPKDLRNSVMMRLPPSFKRALPDLNDVAVDPSTGMLWLLSAASSTLGIARLAGKRGVLRLEATGLIPLPVPDLKTEGLAFDRAGRIYIASEANRSIHVLRLVST